MFVYKLSSAHRKSAHAVGTGACRMKRPITETFGTNPLTVTPLL